VPVPASDHVRMERCADCGAPLQTVDLPCPVCEEPGGVPLAAHRYSRTFRCGWAFRPNIAGFVYDVNQWLYEQRGVHDVQPLLHRSVDGVSGVTLDCDASELDAPYVFHLDHVPLINRSIVATGRRDPGEALNAWREAHPASTAVWTNVGGGGGSGLPADCWLLAVTPRAEASAPIAPPPPSGFMGVQRLPLALLSPILVLLGIGAALDTSAPIGSRVGFVSAAVLTVWAVVRFQTGKRRTHRIDPPV
jgi:hypothetical protein